MSRRLVAALFAAMTLSGCCDESIFQRSADTFPPQPLTIYKFKCQRFREWSSNDQHRLAAELKVIPATSEIMRMAIDWRRYYNDAKACAEETHG